ncbi:MAG: Fic family protein [Nanoarchaeota archaeon]
MKNAHFINPGLLTELRHKRDTFVNRVSDETGLRSALLKVAHLEASYHSRITEPDQAVRSRRIGLRRDFRQVRGQLEDARQYSEREFKRVLTEPYLIGLAKILNPSIKGYRTESVFIAGYNHAGVNPAKIKEQMDALNNLVNDISIDPVERAILFHLHFLRIHPFSDGNGRTSRLVQNVLLAENSYAPVALAPGERTFYNDLIHSAQCHFKEREADGDIRAPELMGIPPKIESPEGQFIHYIASKINAGMDSLIGDYDNLPYYQIQLFGFSNPDEVVGVKKILRNHFIHQDKPVHVSVTNRKRGIIEIRTDTNDGILHDLLDKKSCLGYKIFRYD